MRIIVLGAGDVGTHIARVLASAGEVVIVDRVPAALAHVEDALDVLTVRGDITHRRTLLAAEVHKADLVVAVTGSDDANLIGAALSAELGARSVARVDDPNFYQSRSGVEEGILGVHAVLCASHLVGQELLRLVAAADADATRMLGRGALLLSLIKLRGQEPTCGQKLEELELNEPTRLVLVRRDGRLRRPAEITRLEVGDELALIGPPTTTIQSIRRVRGLAPKRGIIIGGGDVGMQLGKLLSRFERRVQIVEKSSARAEQLAEELPNVNVIWGDGSAIATLRDEHVASAHYVAAVTRSDEVNLMASLLAKDLGVPATYTLLHRHGYEEVYRHLGVLGTTGPHDVLAAAVSQLLPNSESLGVQLGNTSMECCELRIPSNAQPRPEQDLVLPPGVFLVARIRGDELIEAGTPLSAGEALILVTSRDRRRELDRCLRDFLKGGG